MKLNNKKGATLGGLTEGALGIVLVVLCMGIIIAGLNLSYSKNNEAPFGLLSNQTLQDFQTYPATIQQGMQGEATTSSLTGISLGTTWQMLKAGVTLGFNFVTGAWIENIIGTLGLGSAGLYLTLIFRLLLIISLGYILLKLILKVNP